MVLFAASARFALLILAPPSVTSSISSVGSTGRCRTFKRGGRTVLKKAGKIAYYCRFHPNMTAEIDVAAK